MSTPHAKRRRLNEATKTLHKPFKSPFRAPLRVPVGSDPPSSDPPVINVSSEIATSSATASTTELTKSAHATLVSLQHPPANSQASDARPPRSVVPRSLHSVPSRALTAKAPVKPSVAREIMQLRNEIQILTQAQTLATSNKDDDLVVLIDRWRVASRAAAEELFATTRDKVNRMGGVGAWKAREKESKERQIQWDREEREAERERLEEAKESGELGDEAFDRWADTEEDSGPAQKEEETFKAADDDSFTMDMMLKTLNVDLDLIGYNKEAQRWEG